jgi:EAL domain-containing protein (putative c-di-GMP-specific phosphodiesterase class I)
MRRILTVAGPEWQAALLNAAGEPGEIPPITIHDAADAVILLASAPESFAALALEAAAGGAWLPTLLDLTLGDTDKAVPLLILGDGDAATNHQLGGAQHLRLPLDRDILGRALHHADTQMALLARRRPGGAFPDVDSIRVRYQPLVRLKDLRPTSVEVLARVMAKDGRLIGPEHIIAAMTNSEYAMQLTSFIIQAALNEVQDGGFAGLGINFAFNLPLDAMMHPDLISIFETMRGNTNMPAKTLGFELTESQPVTDFTRTEIIITALRVAGYRLALDDITPQTPNLDALLKLPFRGIKLDRSVVLGAAGKDPEAAKLNRDFIKKITAHAGLRGRAVVAEGIETQDLLDLMLSLGVTHGQGYFFARPLPARALKPWLEHWMTERK